MICHVLRYAPFYVAVKERLLAGEIGDIINIQATEHVSYHHLAVSFVRGKWGNEEKCGAPMLLAKCCHDMDLIMWLKSGVAPRQVASFGSDFQFDPAKKPGSAGKRCLGGLRHRGKLPVLGQKALHRPSGPLELLCVGLPGASGKAHH